MGNICVTFHIINWPSLNFYISIIIHYTYLYNVTSIINMSNPPPIPQVLWRCSYSLSLLMVFIWFFEGNFVLFLGYRICSFIIFMHFHLSFILFIMICQLRIFINIIIYLFVLLPMSYSLYQLSSLTFTIAILTYITTITPPIQSL